MELCALRYALDASGKQLSTVFDGFPEALMDERLHEGTMSPRETLVHLCECYHAYALQAKGQKHSWGTYSEPDQSSEYLRLRCMELRNACIESGLAHESEEIRLECMDYVALHDSYHIGQIASLRIARQPDWNPYSLYE